MRPSRNGKLPLQSTGRDPRFERAVKVQLLVCLLAHRIKYSAKAA